MKCVVRNQATSQTTSYPVTYYRHPIKGNMSTDNYASAELKINFYYLRHEEKFKT